MTNIHFLMPIQAKNRYTHTHTHCFIASPLAVYLFPWPIRGMFRVIFHLGGENEKDLGFFVPVYMPSCSSQVMCLFLGGDCVLCLGF